MDTVGQEKKNKCLLKYTLFIKKWTKHEKLLLNRLNFPKGVVEQIKLYKASADSYEKIFDECLEENVENIIRWIKLKDWFSNWYRENIGDKISDAKEINVQK